MKKNSLYTIGSLIILLICAFVFVVLPAFTGSSGKQSQALSFGKYNGKDITYEQNSDMAKFVSQYGQLYQSYGMQIDSTNYYRIFNSAFNSTVMKMAYTDAVKKSGYEVPVTAINRQMVPYFSDENGKYSSKLYRQADENSIRELYTSIESDLYSTRFHDDVFGSLSDVVGETGLYGIKESDQELDFLSNFNSNKRGFKMAVFPLSNYPQEEKLAYASSNAAKFAIYNLSVITVEDKSTANTVEKKLAKGELSFDEAITQYSGKNYSDTEGSLTYTYQYQIENILSDKANIDTLAKLNKDEISGIIETTTGFSIFKANETVKAADFTDSNMLTVVSNYLTSYESSLIEDYFAQKAKDFIANAKLKDFAKAGAESGTEIVDIPAFPLNYGSLTIASGLNTSLPALANADTNENFLKKAFSLKMNEISDPIVINSNIVVLQFTTEENDDSSSNTALTQIETFDESSAQNAILTSSKLKNDFITTYFDNFMN